MSDTLRINSAISSALSKEEQEKYEKLLPRTKDFRRLFIKVLQHVIESRVRSEESTLDQVRIVTSVAERKALRQVIRILSTDLSKPLGEPSD